jgi:NAD dependent epimerase/dehydratase family enzyme
MTKQIAAAYHRPIWWPQVPAWALRLVLGEMAVLVTGGNFVSSEKIQKELNFTFTYTRLADALTQIIHV